MAFSSRSEIENRREPRSRLFPQPLEGEHDGGDAAGADYLSGPDQAREVSHGRPDNLDQLVLVGGRRGRLLDAAGEEEVGPVVLEAG